MVISKKANYYHFTIYDVVSKPSKNWFQQRISNYKECKSRKQYILRIAWPSLCFASSEILTHTHAQTIISWKKNYYYRCNLCFQNCIYLCTLSRPRRRTGFPNSFWWVKQTYRLQSVLKLTSINVLVVKIHQYHMW